MFQMMLIIVHSHYKKDCMKHDLQTFTFTQASYKKRGVITTSRFQKQTT